MTPKIPQFTPSLGSKGGAYGGRVDVPGFSQIDIDDVAKDTIAGNSDTLDSATSLAGRTNASQRALNIAGLGPDYARQMGAATSVIDNQLAGRLDDSVLNQISDRAAARGFSMGTPGSGFTRNLELRDVGLTSMQQTEKGLASLNSFWTMRQSLELPQAMQISSLFITPAQRLAHVTGERDSQWNRDMSAAQAWSAPDAAAQAAEEQRAWQQRFDTETNSRRLEAADVRSAEEAKARKRNGYVDLNGRWRAAWYKTSKDY